MAPSRPANATVATSINKCLSTYRRRIDDTVNKGKDWKTPSCICSCQLCIKLEVCCGNCWKLRQLLEAAMGCWRGLQYDGKCSFYFNCYFFRTPPTNRDLRQKAVYFPARHEQSYSSLDHFRGAIAIPAAIGESAVAQSLRDSQNIMKHLENIVKHKTS